MFMIALELKMFLEALKYLSLKMDEKEYNQSVQNVKNEITVYITV